MTKGGLYLRVSTREQAQKKTSIEAQERALREYAKKNGINVIEVFVDGSSGTNIDRPEFQRMLSCARSGMFDVILVWKYDRFARNLIDQEITILELQKIDVVVKSITESNDRLLRRVMGAVNEEEIVKTLERSKLVKDDRARQGYHLGRAPYGYNFNPDTHELVQNEDADRVRELFRLRELWGLNVTHFAEDNGLTRQAVYGILKNPVYKGFVRYQGKLIKGRHEGIID